MVYTGQSITPYESRPFVTGAGRFVSDLTLPNMRHAVVVRSQHARATLNALDVTNAHAQPGEITVLQGRDLIDQLGPIPPPVMGPGRPVDALQIPTHPLLAADQVCYTGQPLAIVVADALRLAQDAAESIEVDYDALSPVVNPLDAVREDAPVIHPELGTNVAMRVHQQGGDLDAAFARADHVIRQRFDVPRVAPAPLETRGVVADYQPLTDQLTVWNATQAPHRLRMYLAQLLSRPEDTIRVIAPDVGGSFGVKDCLFPEDILIPYLALQHGQPIKWIETRREHLLAYHGRGQWFDIETAVRRDGTILGIRAEIVADLGAYMLRTTPYPAFNACRRLTGPYHIPAVQIDLRGVITNQPPTGAFRGTGGPESAFCMERTMDLIALDIGLDPADVRQRNFIPQDAFPYRTATGVTYDPGQYGQALKRTLELLHDTYWRAEAKRRQPHEPRIGVGLATCLKSSGASGDHRQEHARVQIAPTGDVIIDTGISPHGQGSEIAFPNWPPMHWESSHRTSGCDIATPKWCHLARAPAPAEVLLLAALPSISRYRQLANNWLGLPRRCSHARSKTSIFSTATSSIANRRTCRSRFHASRQSPTAVARWSSKAAMPYRKTRLPLVRTGSSSKSIRRRQRSPFYAMSGFTIVARSSIPNWSKGKSWAALFRVLGKP